MLRRWRHFRPPGGDDPAALAESRRQMVQHDLAGRGIQSPRVLEVLGRLPRELFISASAAGSAYDDRALAIGCEQTISQPYIVALMSEALDLLPTHHVLEVGTGSGYQTAVLAELAHDVVTVERHAELSHNAQRIIEELGYNNVRFAIGDGTQGWPPCAPYDRILVTAAALALPAALWDQLLEGGLLVAPLGPPDEQLLQLITKRNGRREERTLTACRFVPLVGGVSESPSGANLGRGWLS
jgi:protein-L-isoaspartate(D-aspartate) O-methyltransferase